MEEQLSGACTVEIAAFSEFTAVLGAPQETAHFDHVLFDTAPTGHTLRLLTLPSAWSGYVAEHPAGASCLGPLAGLDRQREQYAAAVKTLADGHLTTLVLVARAEVSALREASRARDGLASLGVRSQQLVVNGLVREAADDPTAVAFSARQAAAMAAAPAGLGDLRCAGVDLVAGDVTGIAALRGLVAGAPTVFQAETPVQWSDMPLPGLDALVDELDAAGNGVVMTMGKGGVGKTTLAAALALALVDRDHEVTLSTTDPAAHLTDALADAAPAGLRVERIDPAVEIERYSEEVLAGAGPLDEEGRALLVEDLRSPCTEEIAVFRAFARTVDQARERIVVLDTAPTGHTLLLLDAAQSYQREIQRTSADVPEEISDLLARLRDPEFARLILVTLAESTPVHEAERLQADLRRAEIEPFGWMINGSLLKTETRHPVLAARAAGERRHVDRVRELSRRTWMVGWQPVPPTGAQALRDLGRQRDVRSRLSPETPTVRALAARSVACQTPRRLRRTAGCTEGSRSAAEAKADAVAAAVGCRQCTLVGLLIDELWHGQDGCGRGPWLLAAVDREAQGRVGERFGFLEGLLARSEVPAGAVIKVGSELEEEHF